MPLSRRTLFAAVALALALGGPARAKPTGAHAFALPGIDGAPIRLADFAGRPVLVVNTASRCGFTPQYEGLQALWSRYRDRGLVVIGAPSDDFAQELDNAAEVKEFCEVNFSIDFPMTDIVSVTGAAAHPFFAWAAAEGRAPRWNFTKYLIDGEGRLVGVWGSGTEPAALAETIEPLLAPAG